MIVERSRSIKVIITPRREGLIRPYKHLTCCWIKYIIAKDTHALAEANQAKNLQLKAAFGISDHYVDGSSFDPNRRVKEEAARALAMAKQDYNIVQEESSESEHSSPGRKKKKKKKNRSESESPVREKKKKSKRSKRDVSEESPRKKKKVPTATLR